MPNHLRPCFQKKVTYMTEMWSCGKESRSTLK